MHVIIESKHFCFLDFSVRIWKLKYINQLLSENKLYSLHSTYNFCAFKNLEFRFQEKNLNLNRNSNPRSASKMFLKINNNSSFAQCANV
jgi:hypothetical protein